MTTSITPPASPRRSPPGKAPQPQPRKRSFDASKRSAISEPRPCPRTEDSAGALSVGELEAVSQAPAPPAARTTLRTSFRASLPTSSNISPRQALGARGTELGQEALGASDVVLRDVSEQEAHDAALSEASAGAEFALAEVRGRLGRGTAWLQTARGHAVPSPTTHALLRGLQVRECLDHLYDVAQGEWLE